MGFVQSPYSAGGTDIEILIGPATGAGGAAGGGYTITVDVFLLAPSSVSSLLVQPDGSGGAKVEPANYADVYLQTQQANASDPHHSHTLASVKIISQLASPVNPAEITRVNSAERDGVPS